MRGVAQKGIGKLCPSLLKVGGEKKGRGGEGVVVVRDTTTKERKCDMVEVG
ncbi:MAG: hypothetical protein GY820_47750 [Gammaproteobacteria bacterium]|nr:hypothetical protein [Gammaproteobacteria bacterium]